MPWWWSVAGADKELNACTMTVSVDWTSYGGGLISFKQNANGEHPKNLRPRIVDANDSAWKEAVGISIFHVGEIPPNLVHSRKGGRGEKEQQSP
jgi:hypothetical protein